MAAIERKDEDRAALYADQVVSELRATSVRATMPGMDWREMERVREALASAFLVGLHAGLEECATAVRASLRGKR